MSSLNKRHLFDKSLGVRVDLKCVPVISGRLKQIGATFLVHDIPKAVCICDCGQRVVVSRDHLRSGHTKSCGCSLKEFVGAAKTTHGKSKTAEYFVWSNMVQRCTNPKKERYPRYGGRGIKVCERWNVFVNFIADMGPRPSLQHSIDRIDNDGNYEPGNCRWATRKQQQSNNSRTRMVSAFGETKMFTEWRKDHRLEVAFITFERRLNNGESPEYAMKKRKRVCPCSESKREKLREYHRNRRELLKELEPKP